jgi:uncharacterized protein
MDEMIAVASRWPNVHINVSAWLPKYFSPALVQFISTDMGSRKVIFGSNGLPWERYMEQMSGLGIRPERLERILRVNALELYGLAQPASREALAPLPA